MAKVVEDCKVIHTNCNGLTTPHSQSAESYTQSTNALDCRTGQRHREAESKLCAVLAQAGHSIHPLNDGGFLVAKWGYTHEAKDLADLKAFAVRLGVCHE